GRTGTLTSSAVSGLGLATPIAYTNFAGIHLALGSGNDTFTVATTISGITTVEGRGGNNTLYVQSVGGPTAVAAGGITPTVTYGDHVLSTGSGTDSIQVSSSLTGTGGTIDGIASYLHVLGAGGVSAMVEAAPLLATTTSAPVALGQPSFALTSTAGVVAGDQLVLGSGARIESLLIIAVSGNTVTVAGGAQYAHLSGERAVID